MKKHHLRLRWLPGIRGIRGILIFLLLGAIFNVAVAWGCALPNIPRLYPHAKSLTKGISTDKFPFWVWLHIRWTGKEEVRSTLYFVAPEVPNVTPRRLKQITGNPPTWVKLPPIESMKNTYMKLITVGSGWPFLSLQYQFRDTRSFTGLTGGYRILKTPRDDSGIVPFTPLWRGFALNTLLYAVILWLLNWVFRLPFTLRRHRRIRRGRCGQCGYLVAPNIGLPGASPNCPECGTPIPEKLTKTAPE